MPRGGRRQGTPGAGYSNRTDLMTDYDNSESAASGGQAPPVGQVQSPQVGADQVPNLGDATTRPWEPVTTGLSVGEGAGTEAMGPMPPGGADPVRRAVQALLMASPENPDLIRLMNRLTSEGR